MTLAQRSRGYFLCTLALLFPMLATGQPTTEPSPIPQKLDGYYLVSSTGRVLQYSGDNELLRITVIVPSKVDRGMNITRGEFVGISRYSPTDATLESIDFIYIPNNLRHRYSHCEYGVHSEQYQSRIKPLKVFDTYYFENQWTVYPTDNRGVCLLPSIDPSVCKAVKCQKYQYSESTLTNDLNTALGLSRDWQKLTPGKSYKQLQREADRYN